MESLYQKQKCDVALIHYNVVTHAHQQKSRVLYSFVPDVQFGQLINVKLESLIYLKTKSAEFSFIKVWFTNQKKEPLEIDDNVNITHIVGLNKTYYT